MFNSQRQPIYRIAHGLGELVRFLSVHAPVERLTDISAEQSKLSVIQVVNRRVLVRCEPKANRH